jgi:trans-aconitate 2-methyltransferase
MSDLRYTFGNTITAAGRLQRMAEFFNPLSADFIRQNINGKIGHVADMGCGPGYTTRMLADVTRAGKVTGLDQSDFFIEQARINFPYLAFRKEDVTKMNPGKKYDLLYCRFLLSHLTNLPDLIRLWLSCLQTGGKLILDEFEDVITEVPLFKTYIQISGALVKSQGAELHVGRTLNEAIAGFHAEVNQTQLVPVRNWMAAGWFYPNTTGAWKDSEYIKRNFPDNYINPISEELLEIYNCKKDESNITWKMKYIVLTNKILYT